MTNEELLSVAEIVERATNRFNKLIADMKAEHESEMAKQRATMGVRIDADAKIIAGLREERNALRAEVTKLHALLKNPTHPVKVGEHVAWCGSGFLTGTIKQVAEVRSDRAYRFTDDDVWSFALCEPCDPPSHDTEAGKAAAESAAHSAEIDIGTRSRKVTT